MGCAAARDEQEEHKTRKASTRKRAAGCFFILSPPKALYLRFARSAFAVLSTAHNIYTIFLQACGGINVEFL
jgi:hypothetical protein